MLGAISPSPDFHKLANLAKTCQICVIRNDHKLAQRTPVANNEASDGKRPPRSAAATDRLFLPASARRLSLLGSLGDTAIELVSEVVTWLVLVRFERRRGMKNRVCATASTDFEASQTV